jgi:NNP family nitrate/nitrite transporter-like MFS transporter
MFFAPRLAEMVGWRGVFGLMAIPIVMTMVLFLTVVRCDPPVLSDHSRDWLTPTKELLRRPAFYWLSAVYGVTFGGFVGFCSALPVFLYDQYRIDQVTAGAIAALCGLTGSVMRPVGGYTADSIGGLKVLQAVLPLVGGLTLAIGRLPTMAWMVVLTVCAVAVMGFGNGVVFQIVSDWYRKQIGAAAGLIGAAGGIGGFLFPFWLGFLKDVTGTFRVGFWVFAVGAFIAGLSVVVMRHGEGRTHGT